MNKFRNPLLRIKFSYGYDVSGEVNEGGGTSGQDNSLSDLGEPGEGHKTPQNPANLAVDSQAEQEFPDLAAKVHDKVHWPPRTR